MYPITRRVRLRIYLIPRGVNKQFSHPAEGVLAYNISRFLLLFFFRQLPVFMEHISRAAVDSSFYRIPTLIIRCFFDPRLVIRKVTPKELSLICAARRRCPSPPPSHLCFCSAALPLQQPTSRELACRNHRGLRTHPPPRWHQNPTTKDSTYQHAPTSTAPGWTEARARRYNYQRQSRAHGTRGGISTRSPPQPNTSMEKM